MRYVIPPRPSPEKTMEHVRRYSCSLCANFRAPNGPKSISGCVVDYSTCKASLPLLARPPAWEPIREEATT